jgi:hypothetical protein
MGKSRYDFVKNMVFNKKILFILVSYDLQEKAQKSMTRVISGGISSFEFTILMFFEAEKEAFGPRDASSGVRKTESLVLHGT